MPRKTRHSQSNKVSPDGDNTALQGSTNIGTTLLDGQNPATGRAQTSLAGTKRTSIDARSVNQATRLTHATKRARMLGPVSSHQVTPGLPTEEEGSRAGEQGTREDECEASEQPSVTAMRQLQRTNSFYPGRGNNRDTLLTNTLFENNQITAAGDSDVESEGEWITGLDLDEPAAHQSSRASEALAIERPLWQASAPLSQPSVSLPGTPSPSTSVPSRTVSMPSRTVPMSSPSTSIPSRSVSVLNSSISSSSASVPSQSASIPSPASMFGLHASTFGPSASENITCDTWPDSETQVNDTGASRANYGNDAIGTARAPASAQPLWPADTNLVFASGSNRVMMMQQRPLIRIIIQDGIENLRANLLFENGFPDMHTSVVFTKLSLLTAARSHYPGASFIHRRLLSDKEYIGHLVPLPRARIPLFRSEIKERCSALVLAEFLSINSATRVIQDVDKQLFDYNYTFPLTANVTMRSHPYRNQRIITVIRDLYFTGGVTSFARRFDHLFPTHQHHNGVTMREVPIPMVALVATALYAALYEWRTGVQRTQEFSSTAFLDVYEGNVGTMNHLREVHVNAFHLMMADIYTKVSSPGGTTVPIAQLDLNQLEG